MRSNGLEKTENSPAERSSYSNVIGSCSSGSLGYLTLAKYLWLAEQVTGVDATVLEKPRQSPIVGWDDPGAVQVVHIEHPPSEE